MGGTSHYAPFHTQGIDLQATFTKVNFLCTTLILPSQKQTFHILLPIFEFAEYGRSYPIKCLHFKYSKKNVEDYLPIVSKNGFDINP